jgi:hypothetical protein
MRRGRWIIVGVIAVLLIAVVAAALWLLSRAAQVSSVEVSSLPCIASGDACLRFPTISGDNLLAETFHLPANFSGRYNLVILPFDEAQQVKAVRWLPLAQELAAANPDFAYYNLPVFPSMAAPLRAIIRTGMNFTVPEALRPLTITVFLDDRDAFLAALNIPDTEAMQVFLLNDDGEVMWRGAGEFDEAQGNALRAAVE